MRHNREKEREMNKHEYICAVTEVVRSKSDCFKRKVGAVFVNSDYEILATGYNAPPKGLDHCDRTEGTLFYTCGDPCSRNIHAEMNAIAQAAKRGTALKGSTLYCTYMPCVDCARMLVNVGIINVRVHVWNRDGGEGVLKQANIPVAVWRLCP